MLVAVELDGAAFGGHVRPANAREDRVDRPARRVGRTQQDPRFSAAPHVDVGGQRALDDDLGLAHRALESRSGFQLHLRAPAHHDDEPPSTFSNDPVIPPPASDASSTAIAATSSSRFNRLIIESCAYAARKSS